jgi:hypothetical protein
MNRSGRFGQVRFAPELLLSLCCGWFRVIENSIPRTARFVDGYFEDGTVVLIVEDGSLAEVALGETVPILPPPVVESVVIQCPECGGTDACLLADVSKCVRRPDWVYGARSEG